MNEQQNYDVHSTIRMFVAKVGLRSPTVTAVTNKETLQTGYLNYIKVRCELICIAG